MDNLYKLRDMLFDELDKYGAKNELSGGSLEIVDKLAHALKNLNKVIDAGETGGSYGDEPDERREDMWRSARGGSYGRSYNRSRSYRGYSRNKANGSEEMVEQLRGMMGNAPTDQIRQEMQALIERVERQQ